MSVRRVAVCVDDYGLHAGIDQAVLSLASAGRITAVSCMVGGPSWTSDASSLRQAARSIDVGLHLDFTEFPIDPALRKPLRTWMIDTFLRRIDRDAVQAEIRSQLDRFENAMGQAPAHVDGHQHVHQFPVVRDLLVQILLERYGHGRHGPWLRSTKRAPGAGFKAWVIEGTGHAPLQALCRRHGFTQNGALLGSYDFRGGPERYQGLLRHWLAHAHDTDLLMCHPATTAPADDAIGLARVNEFQVLGSPAFDQEAAQAGVTLVRMSHVLRDSKGSTG